MRPRSFATALLVVCAACSGGGLPDDDDDDDDPPIERAHDARFIGLWAVEQNSHALYEVTYYDLGADGALGTGPSDPAGCTGHLSEHCVTGSVAACVPEAPGYRCEAALSCVFGATWWSRGSDTLVIAGDCSDGAARPIELLMNADASSNAGWAGAGATLVSVGGDANWSHDNWDWTFRKCPPGTGPTDCLP